MMNKGGIIDYLTQERIVIAVTIIAFIGFSTFLPGFLTTKNLLDLTRNIAILGILGVGLAIVVIGRGIDLSVAAVMAVCAAWAIKLSGMGVPEVGAISIALALAILIGLLNGFLVAFAEIPAIFVTLATALVIYGVGQFILIQGLVIYIPATSWMIPDLGQARPFGIPIQLILFVIVGVLGQLFLSYVRWGRFTYAMGDNSETARLTGIKVRPLIVGQYVLVAIIAYVAGLTLAGANPVFSLRTTEGTLLNGMTIMDLPQPVQDLVKGLVLLSAIVADAVLHPRDEQTSRQSDI
jgi:ribose transport system permease protein